MISWTKISCLAMEGHSLGFRQAIVPFPMTIYPALPSTFLPQLLKVLAAVQMPSRGTEEVCPDGMTGGLRRVKSPWAPSSILQSRKRLTGEKKVVLCSVIFTSLGSLFSFRNKSFIWYTYKRTILGHGIERMIENV